MTPCEEPKEEGEIAMNVLIVDDDAYVVEALKEKMEWNRLEIDQVYSAYNVKHAKRLIDDVNIHIVVCDIEMPKENGFLLLEWVRSKKLVIQFIFLTSYAEFEYAKKAIELKTFAYILKPVSYSELAQQICSAVEAEKEALGLATDKRGALWADSLKQRRDIFWTRYCVHECYLTPEELWKGEQQLHLELSEKDLFIPLLCGLGNHKGLTESLGQGRLDLIFRSYLSELFGDEGTEITGCTLAGKEWLIIFRVRDGELREELFRDVYRLIARVEEGLHTSLSCIIGSCTDLENLLEQFRSMKRLLQKNIVGKSGIYETGVGYIEDAAYTPPDFAAWEQLFKAGKEESLCRELSAYMARAFGKKYVSQKVLVSFVMDFLQLLGTPLRERKIMLHSVDDSGSDSDILKTITQSVEQTEKYLMNMLHKSMEVIRVGRENLSAVQYARQYIEKNLEKNITRESIAELVYLNPDYLARMFKREYGESLSSFLLRRRMETAREALLNTNASINEIAVRVGYDNFSYFAKVFKETWGQTPKDYRKAYKK